MASIRILNIGSLRDTGEIKIKPVTLFLGKQSTGKSTLMKILCFCRWMEKRIAIGSDDTLYQYTHYSRFIKELKQFHRLNDGFFSSDSLIDYKGDWLSIRMEGGKRNVKIEKHSSFDDLRCNSKLCFIPSERNLLSAVKNIDRAYRSDDLDVLFNYIFEWGEAREAYTSGKSLKLSFDSNMEYFYDEAHERDVVRLIDKHKEISPFYASSGVQSALPIEVLVNYLGGIVNKPVKVSRKDLLDVVVKYLNRKETLKDIDHKMDEVTLHLLKYYFIQLFIEEPEQNLFPESQWALILQIAKALNRAGLESSKPSYVVMTTHSPYILTSLNVLMKSALAYKMNREKTLEVVDENAILPVGSIAAYYIENGGLVDLVDEELNMISGEDLDGLSVDVEDKIAVLNEIIYE